MALSATIRGKIGTTEEWESANKQLALGEFGIEIVDQSTFLLKIGDGERKWKDLPYANNYNHIMKSISTLKDVATSEDNGLMSIDDKKKLDLIDDGANNYVHPQPMLGKTGTFTKVTVDKNGHVIEGYNYSMSNASINNDGLLSKEDKIKLDSIDNYANNYTLDKATKTKLGGIIVGKNLSITSSGVLNADVPRYTNATHDYSGLMSNEDKKRLDELYTYYKEINNK